MNKILSRRDVLRLMGGVGAAFTLSSCSSVFGQRAVVPTKVSQNSQNTASSFVPDVELALRATPSQVSILAGNATNVWTYQGEVLKGEASTLQALEGSYLGPIIRVRTGQKVRIHFTNELDAESVIHWHGLHLPDEADGHPRYAIPKGDTYVYEFEVRNRAGTYWFHPHPHGQTAPQVYYGLAGLFLVSDEEEAALALPRGEFDLPLVIQDRIFNANNQFVYAANGMMDQMTGFLGDQILVNGQPNVTLPVATRAYRFRLLNGSNSRIYKLAWDDNTPLTVIGTDGGLLESPVQRDYVTLAPGERVELWADFSGRPVGTQLVLRSLPFAVTTMGGGMMGGMMNSSVSLGAAFPILTVRVEREENESLTLPQQFTPLTRYSIDEAVNRTNPRQFSFEMQHMSWAINGRTFEMEGVADDEVVRLNTLEVWELINEASGGGMMGGMMGGMAMPHPIHIHGLQFQVIERQISSEQRADWESVSAGYVDEGWKDTVLVMPGERVKLLLKFSDYEGLFVYHCHNLEHEDMGMMRNYLVRA